MITLKFGGTSMESARRILSSADIIISRAKSERVSVVVSAVAGVSNKLQESIDACVKGMRAENFVHETEKNSLGYLRRASVETSGFECRVGFKRACADFRRIRKIINRLCVFRRMSRYRLLPHHGYGRAFKRADHESGFARKGAERYFA